MPEYSENAERDTMVFRIISVLLMENDLTNTEISERLGVERWEVMEALTYMVAVEKIKINDCCRCHL